MLEAGLDPGGLKSAAGAAGTPALSVRRLSKTWANAGRPVEAIHDLSFDVTAGEILALVGPSGCGKSTCLRIVAGMEQATAGEVRHAGKIVSGASVDRMLLFQESLLLPWRTVLGNVELPLMLASQKPGRWYGTRPAQITERARAMLQSVRLGDTADAFPRQLSSGMRQRLALAAAMVVEPSVLLLDEPFSFLDVRTRWEMQTLLLEMWRGKGMTVVLITHQVEESLLLADHIVMLSSRPGRKLWEHRLAHPRPSQDEFFSKEFSELREHMLRLFFTEVLPVPISDRVRD